MNKNKPLSEAHSQRRTTQLMWLLSGVGAAWFILGFTLYIWHFHSTPISDEGKEWGDFGVFIGGFSGTGIAALTLFAAAYGIRVQAADLARSRAFMARQSETMAQQAFDSVFFNMLNRFSDVRDSITDIVRAKSTQPRAEQGRQAFKNFYNKFHHLFKGMIDEPDRKDYLRRAFLSEYKSVESELGPYFRTLYQIYKFIDRSSLTEPEKIHYAKMARAQLSDVELCVIFYDGVTDLAVKFKPLIEKYGILKHVNAGHLLIEDDRRNLSLYARSAFEE